MSILQILVLIFSLFALSRVILRAQDKKLNLSEFIFWMLIWTSLIILAFFPSISTYFAGLFGIGRGVDIIVYISIGMLFYLIFRLYVKLEEIEQNLTVIVRKLTFMEKNERSDNK